MYGVVLAFAVLGLISAVVLTCFTVVRVRLVLYFTCGILMFMAVITFAMLIVFGVFLPNISQACAYIDKKISTEAGLVDVFDKLLFNSSGNLFAKCSPTTGSGDIIYNLNAEFYIPFQSINLISSYTLKFNNLVPNFQTANFQKPFTEAAAVITQVKTTVKLEIQDTVALNFLTALANKVYTKNAVTCTNVANINGDSWVPSRSIITCQGGSYAQNACNDLSNTVQCPLGCYQIYEQLNTAAGDSASYSTHLNARYGTGCNYA